MEYAQEKLRGEVAELYESRPYPPIGLFGALTQGVRWEERQTLNYSAAYSAAYGTTEGAAESARILVAGCGTFEPIVVAMANPQAQILAADLSGRSLRKLEWNIKLRGLGNRIQTWQGDVEQLPASFGNFDFVIASGLLHHLPDPAKGLRALVSRSGDKGVFRMMVYSKWGRSLLYGAKALAQKLGIKDPKDFRLMIDSLPANHPYKIYFLLYSDARTDGGLADGYLHPCDQPVTALELRDLLASAGLEASGFLHSPEGQPEAADKLAQFREGSGTWERLQVLEAVGELQENFRFFARKAGPRIPERFASYEWNEALPQKGNLHVHMLGKKLEFNKSETPEFLPLEQQNELKKAYFLLPRGARCTP